MSNQKPTRDVYGVLCDTCEHPLVLGDAEPYEPSKLIAYVAPLDGVPCPECGSRHVYRSDQIIQFQIPDAR